ncbi:MAG: alpha/beta fold hydrolase [Bacteroidota bacterium]
MKLNYKSIGQGQPLIILHGLFGASDNWLSIAKQLEKDYQIFLIDQRNHGGSPHSHVWNYETMADDIKEFMNDHQLERAVIMGHSMGGKTAMNFAYRFGEMIMDLIVVDIGPKYYPVHHQTILSGLRSIDLKSLGSRQEADQLLSKSIPEIGIRQFLLKNLSRNRDNQFSWKINLDVIEDQIENVGEALPLEQIYDGECLFIRGDKSDYIKEEDLSELAVRFPQNELQTVSGAGHWVHAEKPREFLSVLNTYLND